MPTKVQNKTEKILYFRWMYTLNKNLKIITSAWVCWIDECVLIRCAGGSWTKALNFLIKGKSAAENCRLNIRDGCVVGETSFQFTIHPHHHVVVAVNWQVRMWWIRDGPLGKACKCTFQGNQFSLGKHTIWVCGACQWWLIESTGKKTKAQFRVRKVRRTLSWSNKIHVDWNDPSRRCWHINYSTPSGYNRFKYANV